MNNKVVNITILVLLAVFIFFRVQTALNQMGQDNQTANEPPEIELPSSYYGVVPCADCPGIRYLLHVDETSYTEYRWYIEKESSAFKTSGNWVIESDTLFIFDENEDPYQAFIIEPDNLILLDQEQNRVLGELAEHHHLERIHEATSIRDHHQRQKNDGVLFFATGNEPFWNIRIFRNGHVKLTTPEYEHRFDDVAQSKSDDVYTLSASHEDYQIEISYKEEFCRDSMSGYIFTHSVTYTNDDGRTSRGCGSTL